MVLCPSNSEFSVLYSLFFILLWPAVSAGQALETNPASATALSLAGAGVTAVQDPVSLWINPANLVHSGARVAAGLGLEVSGRSAFRLGAINEGSPEARDGAGARLSPHVGIALPLWERRLWAGVGYHLELNHRSRYPVYPAAASESLKPTDPTPVADRNGPVRFLGTELLLQQHVVSVGLAFRWRLVAVGAALELSHLRLVHRRTLWAGFKGDGSKLEEPELNVDALVEARGLLDAGAVFGMWLRPVSFVELGVALRMPVRSRLEGDATLTPGEGSPHGYSAWTARGGEASLEVMLPLQVEAGLTLSWRSLRLFLQLSWRQWSAMDSPTAELEDAAMVLSQAGGAETWPLARLPLGIDLGDHLAARAGLQWSLWSGFLVLRTGYAFHHGGTPAESPTAVLLDLDRHVWSVGAEVSVQRVRLGLAVQHSFQAALDATGERALLHNPLDSTVTAAVGEGRYQTDMTRVLLEARVGW